jgi:hypothetical protein
MRREWGSLKRNVENENTVERKPLVVVTIALRLSVRRNNLQNTVIVTLDLHLVDPEIHTLIFP